MTDNTVDLTVNPYWERGCPGCGNSGDHTAGCLVAIADADEFEQDHYAPEFEPEDLSLSEASYFDFEYPMIGGDSDLGGEW